MRAFLDFEASSLADDGYPIEVGWVFETGEGEGWLIRPAPDWTDWDPAAQAIHGLTPEVLQAQGVAHDVVARRLLQALEGHEVYASAPSWDGKWLSLLLRAAGLPRHALRLKDSDEAHLQAASEALRDTVPSERLAETAAEVLARARASLAGAPVRHRALEDARQELRLWQEVQRLAMAVARAGP